MITYFWLCRPRNGPGISTGWRAQRANRGCRPRRLHGLLMSRSLSCAPYNPLGPTMQPSQHLGWHVSDCERTCSLFSALLRLGRSPCSRGTRRSTSRKWGSRPPIVNPSRCASTRMPSIAPNSALQSIGSALASPRSQLGLHLRALALAALAYWLVPPPPNEPRQ